MDSMSPEYGITPEVHKTSMRLENGDRGETEIEKTVLGLCATILQ